MKTGKLNSVGEIIIDATSGPSSIKLYADDGINYLEITAPTTLSGNVNWYLPPTNGIDGQVLTTDGAGELTWTTVSGGGGGSVTSVAVSSSTLSVSGSPITSSGTITLDLLTQGGVTPAAGYNTFTLNNKGIITAASTISYVLSSLLGVNSGVATLDGSGKLLSTQIPAIAITDTFVVASQVAMLALSVETGDVAVRTDISKSFILKGTDPTILSDWQELLSPTGTITLTGDVTGSGTTSITTTIVQANINLSNVSGTLNLSTQTTGTLATTRGGTGLTSFTANNIFYASSSSAIGQIAPTGTNTFLQWTGSAYQWSSGNSGTVTSVGLTAASSKITIGGTSPITTSGAFTVDVNEANLTLSNLGGTLSTTKGGTGLTTYTTGDILYAIATNTLSKLAAGTNTQVLTLAGGIPTWASPTTGTVSSINITAGSTKISSTGGPITTSGSITVDVVEANLTLSNLSGTLEVAKGGTGATTLTGLIKGNGTSAFTVAVAGTDYVDVGTANTFTAKQTFVVSSASTASIRLLSGSADPTTPVSGDLWNNTGVLKFYNGATTRPFAFLDGNTFTAKQIFVTSSASTASINLQVGAADPTTPINGDIWNNTGILKFYNGTLTRSFAFLNGNTFTAKQIFSASVAATGASINIPSGVAPTTPVAGDIWNVSNVLTFRGAASRVFAFLDANTFTSSQTFVAGTAALSSFRITNGTVDKTTPVNGDVWNNAGTLKFYNGTLLRTFAFLDTNTFTGKQTFPVSTASIASATIQAGTVDPTTPISGDLWNNTGVLKFYNGTTKTIAFLDSNITGTSSNVSGIVAATNGGTGLSTYTTGDILYASATNTLSKLAAGSNGQILTLAGGIPSWTNASSGTVTSVGLTAASSKITITGTSPITTSGAFTVDVNEANLTLSNLSGTLGVNKGGTGATTLTSNGILLGNGTSAITNITVPNVTDTYLKWNGSAYVWVTISGSGTVTSVATGGGLTGGTITTTGTVALDITGQTTGTIINTDELIYWNGTAFRKTTAQDIANLAVASRYVLTFNATSSWGSPSGGYYTLTINQSTHLKGTNPIVQVFDSTSGNYVMVLPDTISFDTSGNVSVKITAVPDIRFAGRIVII